eukprot:9038667-Alexandrium_andersonii.AAC.1
MEKPAWAKPTVLQADSPEEADPDQTPAHGNLLVLKRTLNHFACLARARKPGPGQQWPTDMHQAWSAAARRA